MCLHHQTYRDFMFILLRSYYINILRNVVQFVLFFLSSIQIKQAAVTIISSLLL